MSVRSPTVVVPRDILGIPVLSLSRFFSLFPPRLADRLSSPLRRITMGDVSEVGLPPPDLGSDGAARHAAEGPGARRRHDGRAPKRRHPGASRHGGFTADGVVFTDGSAEAFDAVVLGTGYEPGVDRFLETDAAVLDDAGYPLVSGD